MDKRKWKKSYRAALCALLAALACGTVQAEETQETSAMQDDQLEAGVAYELDLDGDGKEEQFSWQTTELHDENEISQAVLDLYVNDSQPSSFIDDRAYFWRIAKGPLEDGRTLLFAMSISDNDYSNQVLALTEAEAGQPFGTADLAKQSRCEGDTMDRLLSGWARGIGFVKAKGDTITLRWTDTLSCAGLVSVDLDYQIDGTDITQLDTPGVLDDSRTWTAWQGFSVKTEAGSEEQVFSVGEGEQVTLKQLILKDGMRWILCRNADGQEGWFEDPESVPYEEDGDDYHWGYFEEAQFAG